MRKPTSLPALVRLLTLALSALFAFTGRGRAQLDQRPDDELLDLVRRRQVIEMQRVDAQIRQMLREAQVLMQSAPANICSRTALRASQGESTARPIGQP